MPDPTIYYVPGLNRVTVYPSRAEAIMADGASHLHEDAADLCTAMNPRQMVTAYNDFRWRLAGEIGDDTKEPAPFPPLPYEAANNPGLLAGRLWQMLLDIAADPVRTRPDSFTLYSFKLHILVSLADNGRLSEFIVEPVTDINKLRAVCRLLADAKVKDYSETELRILMFNAVSDGKLRETNAQRSWGNFIRVKPYLIRSGALTEIK